SRCTSTPRPWSVLTRRVPGERRRPCTSQNRPGGSKGNHQGNQVSQGQGNRSGGNFRVELESVKKRRHTHAERTRRDEGQCDAAADYKRGAHITAPCQHDGADDYSACYTQQ